MRMDRQSHGQTVIMELIVALRNFANTPKHLGYDGNRETGGRALPPIMF
jgi:hypothetical protein